MEAPHRLRKYADIQANLPEEGPSIAPIVSQLRFGFDMRDKIQELIRKGPATENDYKQFRETFQDEAADALFVWFYTNGAVFKDKVRAIFIEKNRPKRYGLLQAVAEHVPDELRWPLIQPMNKTLRFIELSTATVKPTAPSTGTMITAALQKRQIALKHAAKFDIRLVATKTQLDKLQDSEIPYFPWDGLETSGQIDLLLREVMIEVPPILTKATFCRFYIDTASDKMFQTYYVKPHQHEAKHYYKFTVDRATFEPEFALESPRIHCGIQLLDNKGIHIGTSQRVILVPFHDIRSR